MMQTERYMLTIFYDVVVELTKFEKEQIKAK